MVGQNWKCIGAITIAVSFASSQQLCAWQTPEDLSLAPRLLVDNDTPVAEPPMSVLKSINGVDVDESAPRTASVNRPAPASAIDSGVVPAEEIVAQPVKPTRTAPRTPSETSSTLPSTATDVTAIDVDVKVVNPSQLKASLFKQAQPGVTTPAQLRQLWGEPKSETVVARGKTLTFALAPFSHVEAHTVADIVQSITIDFATPADAEQVTSKLALGDIQPTEIVDTTGKVFVQIFPERGVTLHYVEQDNQQQVARIQIAPLSADGFVARVQNSRGHHWQRNLADLKIAETLPGADHRIDWLKSEVLSQQSEYREAAKAIEKALTAQPASETYQLTAARLIAEAGNYDDAIDATKAVMATSDLTPLLQARATLQLGDLLAQSPAHDYAQAMQLHQQAIQIALPQASNPSRATRVAAKRILIDAHTGIAADVAQGNWQKKEQSVPQWCDRAVALADECIKNENCHASIQFDVACKRLDAYAWLEGKVDPSEIIKQLPAMVEQAKSESTDATYHRHIDWQYAKAMIDAVDIARARKESAQAVAYGKLADAAMSRLAATDWQNETTQFQLSRLHFLLGSVHAIQLSDHTAAVKWFDKSIDDISRPEPDLDLSLTARRGQWMVSMGISYWNSGQKDTGLRLTEAGVAMVQSAQAAGFGKADALVVPYSNLAFMHEQSGNPEKAQRFSEMAGRLKATTQR